MNLIFNQLHNNNNNKMILDDPSGDSFIENPEAPKKDPNMTISFYKRTQEQNDLLGLNV